MLQDKDELTKGRVPADSSKLFSGTWTAEQSHSTVNDCRSVDVGKETDQRNLYGPGTVEARLRSLSAH